MSELIACDDVRRELERLGATDVVSTPDYQNSISSDVVRCVWRGQRAVAVDTDAATQLTGVLALVDLHARQGGRMGDTKVAMDDVTVLVAELPRRPEAVDAVATLAATAMARGGPRVHVLSLRSGGQPVEVPAVATNFADATTYGYARWAALLDHTRGGPPAWVDALIAAVGRDDVRAYPMLSERGTRWSLRLEGLQVAIADADGARFDVGRTGGRKPRAISAKPGSPPPKPTESRSPPRGRGTARSRPSVGLPTSGCLSSGRAVRPRRRTSTCWDRGSSVVPVR